jgi:mycoredoxin
MTAPAWPPVLVYSMHDCADCSRSKALLRRLGVPYEEIYVEDDEGATSEVIRLNEGRRTLPTIIIGGATVLAEPSDRDLEAALRGVNR